MQKRGLVVALVLGILVLSLIGFVNADEPCGSETGRLCSLQKVQTTSSSGEDVYTRCIATVPAAARLACCGVKGQVGSSALLSSQACEDALNGKSGDGYTTGNGQKSFKFKLSAEYYDLIMAGLESGKYQIGDVWANNIDDIRNEWFKKANAYMDESCYVPACGAGSKTIYDTCVINSDCPSLSSQLGGEWDNTARDEAAADWQAAQNAKVAAKTIPPQQTGGQTGTTPVKTTTSTTGSNVAQLSLEGLRSKVSACDNSNSKIKATCIKSLITKVPSSDLAVNAKKAVVNKVVGISSSPAGGVGGVKLPQGGIKDGARVILLRAELEKTRTKSPTTFREMEQAVREDILQKPGYELLPVKKNTDEPSVWVKIDDDFRKYDQYDKNPASSQGRVRTLAQYLSTIKGPAKNNQVNNLVNRAVVSLVPNDNGSPLI